MVYIFKKLFYFSLAGTLGYIINAIVLYISSTFIEIEWVIWCIATICAIIAVFIVNSVLTFKSSVFNSAVSHKKRFLMFFLSSIGALVMQVVLGTVLVRIYGEPYRQIILPLVIIFVVAPYNWCMYNTVIWKK